MHDLQRYNPFPSFQPGQAEAITQILEHYKHGQKIVELNAPTAAGKSLDLFIVGRILSEQCGVRVVYTTPLVALVNQLENEPAFKAMPVLKGKSNYRCEPLTLELGKIINADDCPYDTWEDAIEAMPQCANCPYRNAYKRFMAAGFGATTLARYQMPGPVRDETTILLVDESANLEKTLIDRATLKIPEKVGLNDLAANLITYYHELQVEIEKISKQIATEKVLSKRVELNKQRNKLSQESRKCAKVMAHIENRHPYIVDRERNFRLLDGRSEFEDMTEDLRFVVLASGTPTTQILTDNFKSVVIQHPIPVERRLVYYDPVGKMNYQERNVTSQKLAKKIVELHNKYHKKTMVHCGSYVVANMIYDKMPAEAKQLCILQDKEDREGSKAKFLAATEAIFLSVAFEEGLDLKGPEYPINIIAKLAFENIQDEYIVARNERDKYRRYNTNTAVAIMQAAGRCTRSINDYSETYILDESFLGYENRCGHLFQPWFKASRRNGIPETQMPNHNTVSIEIKNVPAANTHKAAQTKDSVKEALLYLAGRCDGAVSKDGQGFNGRDAEFGHSLANQLEAGRTLSPKQRAAATKMLTTYKKQLGRAGIEI